jgi:hypothetical protein
VGSLRGVEPQGPGPFQFGFGLGRLLQGQVGAAQGVGAGSLGQGAGGGHLRLERGHPSPQVRLIRTQIPGRLEPEVAGQGLDALRLLGEALGKGRLLPGPDPFPHDEPAEDEGGQCHRRGS